MDIRSVIEARISELQGLLAQLGEVDKRLTGERSQARARVRLPAGQTMPKARLAGKGLKPAQFLTPILEALSELGGRAPREEVTKRVLAKLKDRLGKADEVKVKILNGDRWTIAPRWRVRMWTARQELRRRGFLGYGGQAKEIFKLTKRGENYLRSEGPQEEKGKKVAG